MRSVAPPLVSFIVASYNYERFIGKALSSILLQTMPDFEIVVVDDASTDRSREIVRCFNDPRIAFFVNDRNLGLVETYNKAVRMARGQYISYLDSDDYIEPTKAEEQLDFFRLNRKVDIVTTYINVIDHEGKRHPHADSWENAYNQPFELNTLDTWVGANHVIACSVMLPTSLHLSLGPRDTTMAIGSDFDLWSRAFRLGHVFGIIPRPLTGLRVHGTNKSTSDDQGSLLEVSFVLHKNIVPLIEKAARRDLLHKLVAWHNSIPQFHELTKDQRFRLLALLLGPQRGIDCIAYKRTCLSGDDPELVSLGKTFYATYACALAL